MITLLGSGGGNTNIVGRATSPSLSSGLSVLTGNSVNVGYTVTNTSYFGANQTQDALTGGTVSGAAAVGSVASSTFGALAVGSPTSSTVSYSVPSNSTAFGYVNVALTASGTGATGAALTNSPQSTTVNVIGVTGYGTLFTSNSGVTSSYTGLQTEVGTGTGIGNTSALILAGTGSASDQVTETWRPRNAGEYTAAMSSGGTLVVGSGKLPLFSDVVTVGGTTAPYVLQLSYDPGQVAKGNPSTSVPGNSDQQNANAAAAAGQVYLGSSSGGSWAMSGTGSNLGAYNSALDTAVGDWGVNTANNTVWEVVKGGGTFAVVPEPGTLALLAAGVAALGVAYRRRKAAKA